jgi:GNAT superfamily N-acetyltransferase
MGYLIRRLEEAEIDEAAALLVSAFQDRPFYRYLAPDEAERRKFLAVNFGLRLREGFGVNDMQVCRREGGGGISGIAVWAPPSPDRDERPPEEAFARFSAPLRERFFCFLDILHTARDASVRPPFWSLAPIAVLPQERGRGAGGALLRSKLRELDGQNVACFLGTQDSENAALYEHFGFKTERADRLPGSDLVHYTMLRQPY